MVPISDRASGSPAAANAFLAGVRVIEMTQALAGPYCGSVLCDLGAEVIKVEPVTGDRLRERRSGIDNVAYPFEMTHRGKKSFAVDIHQPDGVAIVKALAGTGAVFIQNFRPGYLDGFHLDAASLRARLPGLIYCNISGYGMTGPLRDLGGVDLVAQAHAGLMSVTGEPDGPPAKAGFPVSDLGAGMWGAIGILAALERRRRTGDGATLDVALTDSVLAWAVWELADFQMTAKVPGPLGSAHRLTAPYEAFQCGDDRWIAVGAIRARWRAFCSALDVAALAEDPRFVSESDRYLNREALRRHLASAFQRRPRDEWIRQLRGIGVPCGPVQDFEEVLRDEQFRSREMLQVIDVDGVSVTVPNTPIRSEGAPGVGSGAPGIGADTYRILAELGYEADAIQRLHDQRTVAARIPSAGVS